MVESSEHDREFQGWPEVIETDRRHGAEADGAGSYDPPRVLVLGSVRDLTTGSSASGNKDANSQYYW
jgi:hypothetical protein